MAGPYRELKQSEKAEEVLEESLKLLLESVGEEHRHTGTINCFSFYNELLIATLATCLNNMGLTYKKQKKFAKAEHSYLRYY